MAKDSPSALPTAKMQAVAVAGYLATVVVYILHRAWHVELPAEVYTSGAGILAFAFGYMTKNADHEVK